MTDPTPAPGPMSGAPSPWRLLPPGLMFDAFIAFRLGYLVTGAGNGILWAIKPGHEDLPLSLPQWSREASAAVMLPFDKEHYASVIIEDRGGETADVAIVSRRSDYAVRYDGTKSDFAWTYCKAWLDWQEMKESGNDS